MGIVENNCDFVKPSTGKKLLQSGIYKIEKKYVKNSFEKRIGKKSGKEREKHEENKKNGRFTMANNITIVS